MTAAMCTTQWRSSAACRDVDPEVFFPPAETGPVYEAQVAVAKAVCGSCLVRSECLAEALARIPHGIAGGLTPEERRGRRTRPVGSEPVAVLARGLRAGAGRGQVAAAGRVLLAAGRPVHEVAARCGVTERTAARWAATTAAGSPPVVMAEGSSGGNRAPLLVSQMHEHLAGTRAAEGGRV